MDRITLKTSMHYTPKRVRSLTAPVVIMPLLVLASALAPAEAAVITLGPSDCSAATINTVITASSTRAGDIIQLTCTGSVTWTSTVIIPSTKGITLQVKGATNTPKGSAVFPLTVTRNSGTAIKVTVDPNRAVSRISGFKFAPNTGTADPFIEITGYGTGTDGRGGFRIDNNYFDTISSVEMLAVWARNGNLFGVIDNNTFLNNWRASSPSYGPYNIQIWNYWHPTGSNQCWGCDGWINNDFAYGDVNSVFIEDNLFEHTATAPAHMRHYISSELGARYVSRYNTFVNNYPDRNADLHDAHGLCLVSSNGAGARGGEIYANTISGNGFNRAMQIRGGSWLIYDNVITSGHEMQFNEYRAGSGQCSSSNLVLMPPWPVPTGAKWSANAPWVPLVSDGRYWPLPQQIFNTFVWNNRTPGGALINPSVPNWLFNNDVQQLYIQDGRDYFADAARPAGISSYTSYTYPHPLRSGTGPGTPPPAAPTGLTTTVR